MLHTRFPVLFDLDLLLALEVVLCAGIDDEGDVVACGASAEFARERVLVFRFQKISSRFILAG
jgi:hypothetical protein